MNGVRWREGEWDGVEEANTITILGDSEVVENCEKYKLDMESNG